MPLLTQGNNGAAYSLRDRMNTGAITDTRPNAAAAIPATTKGIFSFMALPNDCGQTRRRAAPTLSVVLWIGCFFMLEGGRVINEMDAILF